MSKEPLPPRPNHVSQNIYTKRTKRSDGAESAACRRSALACRHAFDVRRPGPRRCRPVSAGVGRSRGPLPRRGVAPPRSRRAAVRRGRPATRIAARRGLRTVRAGSHSGRLGAAGPLREASRPSCRCRVWTAPTVRPAVALFLAPPRNPNTVRRFSIPAGRTAKPIGAGRPFPPLADAVVGAVSRPADRLPQRPPGNVHLREKRCAGCATRPARAPIRASRVPASRPSGRPATDGPRPRRPRGVEAVLRPSAVGFRFRYSSRLFLAA